MHLKGIIFDFNGVLLWDARFQIEAWQSVAERLRGFALTDAEVATHIHGRTNAHAFSHLLGRAVHGQELHDLTHGKESQYRDLCLQAADEFVLSPGAEPLLDT